MLCCNLLGASNSRKKSNKVLNCIWRVMRLVERGKRQKKLHSSHRRMKNNDNKILKNCGTIYVHMLNYHWKLKMQTQIRKYLNFLRSAGRHTSIDEHRFPFHSTNKQNQNKNNEKLCVRGFIYRVGILNRLSSWYVLLLFWFLGDDYMVWSEGDWIEWQHRLQIKTINMRMHSAWRSKYDTTSTHSIRFFIIKSNELQTINAIKLYVSHKIKPDAKSKDIMRVCVWVLARELES